MDKVNRDFHFGQLGVSLSMFNKSVRREVAAGRTVRPIDPRDGRGPWVVAACLDWEPWFPLDGWPPSSGTPPCRAPRLGETASTDSPPASRPPSPPPFASWKQMETRPDSNKLANISNQGKGGM